MLSIVQVAILTACTDQLGLVVMAVLSIGHALPDSRLEGWAGRLPAVQGLRPVLPPLHATVFSLLAEHQVMVAHACIARHMQPGLNFAQLVSLKSPE
ncbi:MAG: hypothetical protein FRX49_00733 [Trebouxia sp. A1-2]|nr:MAG: hypothetical protein FRX49_00733 [Trebouxia sp. A1-2]